MPLRFSIRGLIALVFLIGFSLAALRGASLGWATASLLLALIALCTMTAGALTGRRAGRAPWVGFAVFGWAYFLLHFGPTAQWKGGYGPAHLTTWAIDSIIIPRVFPELEEGRPIAGVEEFVILGDGRSGSFFCVACHSLMSIFFGLLGSAIALVIAPEERRKSARPG